MQTRSRKATLWGLVAGTTLAILLAAAPAKAEVREEFHKNYPMAADGRVSLKNVNGGITITAWDKNEVQVDAVKTAESQEKLAEAKIEITAGSSAIDIRTKYPDRSQHNPASVEYTLHVPRKARLDKIDIVNGGITIDGVQGGVYANSVNGEVRAKNVSGGLDMHSVNGRVHAELQTPGHPVDLSTVNGGVELLLPSDAKAELEASTVHGGISNQFNIPATRHRFMPGGELRARLGDGGPKVKLSTVNGGIDIQRASDGKPLSKVTNLLPEDKSRYY